jgi:heat shock protein HtpX
VFLFAALLTFPALAGYVAGGVVLALVLTAVIVALGFGATRYADVYVLRSLRARRLAPWEAPEIFELTEEIARRAELPVPRLFVVPHEQPNAFTVGATPERASIALTMGLLRRLDLRELAGVLAHETAHIKHRDIVLASIASVVTTLVTSLGSLLFWAALLALPLLIVYAPHVLLAVGILGVAPALMLLLQAALSRQRELAADAEASRWTGDPLGLAAALVRLQPRPHPLLRLLFGWRRVEETPHPLHSHPPTRERVDHLLNYYFQKSSHHATISSETTREAEKALAPHGSHLRAKRALGMAGVPS